MKIRAWHWGIAIVFSGVLHAGGAALLLPKQPEVQVAGGKGAEIALAGNAFADLTAAGSPAETLEPRADTNSELTPVEPEVNEAEDVEPVEAVSDISPVIQPSASEEAVSVEPDMQASPIPHQQEPETAETEAAAPETDAVEPVSPGETVTAMVDVPRPTPRPEYTPPKRIRSPQKAQPTPERVQPKQHARANTGSGGHDQHDARRGTAQAGQTDRTSGRETSTQSSAAGNRAVSNYPGKIVSRLRRALRYPRNARRRGAEGEVHVAFTVTRSGSVGNIRVVRGSGSPVLDEAAVETVRRAAPFPAIPPGAGRNAWPFTVPLAFFKR